MSLTIREHAKFAPSAAARWVHCPGSVNLCAMYPEQGDSQEAKEGVAAHWGWAELLHDHTIATGQIAPNGIPLTDEMCEGADLFADVVRENLHPSEFHIEERLPAAAQFIHAENWGTPDVWGRNPDYLCVLDYKFGHRYVEVFRNWQLVDYALMLLETMNIDGHAEQTFKIKFVIVQPRSYHKDGPVRMWTTTAAELRSMRNVLHSACVSAEREKAPCFVNPECLDCTARAHCPTLQQSSWAHVDIAGESSPIELGPKALGLELRTVQRAISILKARASGLEEVALNMTKGGKVVPGFRMEQGMGRESWIKPHAEVQAMGMLTGVSLVDPANPGPKLITPRKAAKLGIPQQIIEQYAGRQTGEMKLVPDDGTLAAKIFAGD